MRIDVLLDDEWKEAPFFDAESEWERLVATLERVPIRLVDASGFVVREFHPASESHVESH